jgi:hypothetical protein
LCYHNVAFTQLQEINALRIGAGTNTSSAHNNQVLFALQFASVRIFQIR